MSAARDSKIRIPLHGNIIPAVQCFPFYAAMRFCTSSRVHFNHMRGASIVAWDTCLGDVLAGANPVPPEALLVLVQYLVDQDSPLRGSAAEFRKSMFGLVLTRRRREASNTVWYVLSLSNRNSMDLASHRDCAYSLW